MDDLARQTDVAVTRLETARAAEAAAREVAISSQKAEAQAETRAKVAAREAAQLDIQALSRRLDALSG